MKYIESDSTVFPKKFGELSIIRWSNIHFREYEFIGETEVFGIFRSSVLSGDYTPQIVWFFRRRELIENNAV
jgi:hypothetical protein